MERREQSDAQWERLRPLLPPQKPRTIRPAKAHRTVLEGIPWAMRTGAPWRDLPARFGPWRTVHSRFRRWQLAGVWDRVLADLQRQADVDGRLNWTMHVVDSTVVRAHQHAAAAKGGPGQRGARPQPGRLRHEGPPPGRTRRKAADRGADRWRAARAAGAAEADCARGGQAAGRGRPRVRPDAVAVDKDYSSDKVRRHLKERRIAAVIPIKSNHAPLRTFDRAV